MNDNTLTQDLLIPFYCGNCQNLVFLHKSRESGDSSTLDCLSSVWKRHSCELFHNGSLSDGESRQEISKLEWGIKKAPFKLKKRRGPQKKQSKPAWAVIISVTEEKGGMLRAITAENTVITLRALFETGELSAGTLIDLSDATRIGPDKYRLAELKQIAIPADLTDQINIPEEFCQIFAFSADQEQLEGFVNRLLKILLKEQISISMITAAPIDNEASPPLHGRIITIYPAPGLIKTLESAVIPDSIQLSVSQVGAKVFARAALDQTSPTPQQKNARAALDQTSPTPQQENTRAAPDQTSPTPQQENAKAPTPDQTSPTPQQENARATPDKDEFFPKSEIMAGSVD